MEMIRLVGSWTSKPRTKVEIFGQTSAFFIADSRMLVFSVGLFGQPGVVCEIIEHG